MIGDLPILYFLLASGLFLIIPGPAVLYIVARTIEGGRRAGLISVVGVNSAAIVHVLVVLLGLSTVLMSSATLFSAVKYAGAAYLIFAGITELRSARRANSAAQETAAPVTPGGRYFWSGFWVNLLSPKAVIFFAAFFPQFVSPQSTTPARDIAILGLAHFILALVIDSGWAMATSSIRDGFLRHTGFRRIRDYLTGGLLAGLGLFAAFSDVRR